MTGAPFTSFSTRPKSSLLPLLRVSSIFLMTFFGRVLHLRSSNLGEAPDLLMPFKVRSDVPPTGPRAFVAFRHHGP